MLGSSSYGDGFVVGGGVGLSLRWRSRGWVTRRLLLEVVELGEVEPNPL